MLNVVVLSDGCRPTEDIYLMRSAAANLQSRQDIQFRYVKCRKQAPNKKLFQKSNTVFVVFRTLPIEWIQYLQQNKGDKRLIYVLDDDLRAAQATPELPDKYRKRISAFANNDLDSLLGLADTLVVSSSHLMDTYKAYQPIRLNPAALRLPRIVADFSKPRLSVAYHATSSHKADLEYIQKPLLNILNSNSCSFESLIGKQTPPKLKNHPKTHIKSPKSYSSFRRFQVLTSRHICLAPLLDTPYNNGKSWIKYLDAAAVGSVGIYSDRAPYNQIVQHGVNGLLASDDPKEWEDCLSFLLKHPQESEKMAKNALKTASRIGSHKWSYRFWSKLLLR